MAKVYSTFSNPSGDLAQLKAEFSDLLNFFSRAEIKKKVDFGFSLNPSIEQITSEIISGQKDIRVFHFSGHSQGTGLDFSQTTFSTHQVAHFFNTICSDQSKIHCIFLNGCQNAEIVHRLKNVPVVIGTQSKIQDTAASKFTRDFFAALVQSDCSYKQAFFDASAAQNNLPISIIDQTRKEGGSELGEEETLNDYFMVINNQRIAANKFPFKKSKRNRTRNLVILFLVITGFIGYLFKDPILKIFRGYTCVPIQTVANKCNFVIADFTTDQTIDFNNWLYTNIRESELIKTYLHPININSFENVIYQNAIDRDSLPTICCYDFNLTGSLTRENDRLRADFSIFPFKREATPAQSFTYHVESLGSLDTLISVLDPTSANQFVLFEVCAACAQQKEMEYIIPVLSDLANSYKITERTAESLQRMQYRLTEVALQYADTLLALRSLDAIAKAAKNDFSLKALEKKVEIHLQNGDAKKAYQAQTEYLNQLQNRLESPTGYQLTKPTKQYAIAANKIRLKRATLVMKHQELESVRPIAKRDFEILSREKFQGKDYSEELDALRSIRSSSQRVRDISTLRSN